MKALLIALTLAATPAFAGGPVLVEDAYEAEPQAQGKANWVVPVAILLIIAAAESGGSKGGGNCYGDPQPEPETGGC